MRNNYTVYLTMYILSLSDVRHVSRFRHSVKWTQTWNGRPEVRKCSPCEMRQIMHSIKGIQSHCGTNSKMYQNKKKGQPETDSSPLMFAGNKRKTQKILNLLKVKAYDGTSLSNAPDVKMPRIRPLVLLIRIAWKLRQLYINDGNIWYDSDRGKANYSGKIPSFCHFFHISRME